MAAAAGTLIDDGAAQARERLGADDAAVIRSRLARHLPDLLHRLDQLYGGRVEPTGFVRAVVGDVVELVARRAPELRRLDRRREEDPDWFQDPRMVGYACYVDRFAGDLPGVRRCVDYLGELGVTYLHAMSVLRPRPGDSDGGYAIEDYDAVDPRIGTMSDLTALAAELHRREMSLCVDFVLNHTAREHRWARQAVAGVREFRDFYLIFPDRRMPDAFERTAPDIFPELSPGSFSYVDELEGWVWTTFREFQWDLDYANPAVFRAMARTMLTLVNRGPDVLRLDAAPFLWKRLGTDCQNQPETHLLLQAFRSVVAIAAPAVLLKAEAMVTPELLPQYLGAHGTQRVPECQLAYDNQLMVMLWSMFATGDTSLARQALGRRPSAPENTGWTTYLRCHDDIGWAVSDADARAVGLDGAEHRRFLSDFYAGAHPGSWATGAVFQTASTGASPISGTAASLCGVEAALRTGDEHAVELSVARLIAMYSIVFSLGGIPLVYMGDELAQRNDPSWSADPSHRHDNRWMHRPAMDWAAAERRSVPGSLEHRVHAMIRRLAAARRALPSLGGGGSTTLLDLGRPGLFGYRRSASGAPAVLALVDVAGTGQVIDADELACAGISDPRPADLGGESATFADGLVHLPPYGFAWLTG